MSLKHTVDYVGLYKIAQSHMQEPVKLLEHLAHLMIKDILDRLPLFKNSKHYH
jgi:7,8-dihydroneopterin aldolase/epimerase/oxygenase